jgi:hypothetical protein
MKIALVTLLSIASFLVINNSARANQIANCALVSGSQSNDIEELVEIDQQTELPFSKAYLSLEDERKMTCDLLNVNAGNWIARIGIPDDSAISVAQVSIYLDDEFSTTTNIFKGQIVELNIDLQNHKKITWHYQINVGEPDYIYFFQWGLFTPEKSESPLI